MGPKKISRENPNLFKTGQKYRELYVKIWRYFVVAGEINSPSTFPRGIKWYQAVSPRSFHACVCLSICTLYTCISCWSDLREILYSGL